ncbi:hypothetical protein [Microbacterium sp. BK668]|uniref:hypothetical protein n=1 Tax=Microbacterium sp. BK668 TaxID=2512118 RepID=UPI0010612E71|nr:hypothetical protein [Microbacterium sp. BK668]TDN92125.1 hypothetical protein EV279_1638 [Microbacterium sp. BK668]
MMSPRFAAAVAGGLLVVGLTACAPQSSLDAAAGASMQDTVVAVAELAANRDTAGATARLDELQSQLDAAIDGDLVTAARAARIQDAIDAVRADLAALSTTPPDPSPTPSETVQDDDGGGSDDVSDDGGESGGNDSGPGDGGSSGNGNSGPGNNNGNGKGSGNGKGGSRGNG